MAMLFRQRCGASPRWTRLFGMVAGGVVLCMLPVLGEVRTVYPTASRPAGDERPSPGVPSTRAASGPDVMERIVALMGEAHEALVVDLDPGPRAQRAQEQIITCLDEAIGVALSQRQSRVGAVQPTGNRLRREQKAAEMTGESQPAATGERRRSPDAPGTRVGVGAASAPPVREAPRGWGNLPDREREEIIQGLRDRVLERYREQIDKYFRALAERSED